MACALIALLLALALEPLMEHVPFSALFLSAVMLSTWYGGLGPGLLATALGTLAIDYFFELPRYSLHVDSLVTAVDLGLFVLTALLIASLDANLRQARRRAEAARRDLAFLDKASSALASSRDYEATLRAVARLAVPALADLCVVDLAAPAPALRYDPTGPDRNCGDYMSQAEAQAFFEAAGGPVSDGHRLDADRKGLACEALP